MLKSGCVLFSLWFVAPFASAEIFKCVGKRGETLYQNFPCESESIAWVPGQDLVLAEEITRPAARAGCWDDNRRSQSHLGRTNEHRSGGARQRATF